MTTKPTPGERFEGVMLVLILLAIGGMAAAASFTHVHDWTMNNSPAGTGDWFGWANAVISDLVPSASDSKSADADATTCTSAPTPSWSSSPPPRSRWPGSSPRRNPPSPAGCSPLYPRSGSSP